MTSTRRRHRAAHIGACGLGSIGRRFLKLRPAATTDHLTRGRTSALAGSLVHKHLDARVPRCRTNDVALEYVLGSTDTVSECSLFGRVACAVGGHILGLVDLLEERILGGEGSFLRLLHLL